MAQPEALLRSKHSSSRPKGLFSRLLTSLRLISCLEASLEETNVPSQTTNVPRQPASLPWEIGHLVNHANNHIRPLLSGRCEWLEGQVLELEIARPQPVIAAGCVADVLVSKIGDRRVVIKSYRCYSSSSYLPACEKFYREALACSRLSHQNIVPFIGASSTLQHPLILVFEYMEHHNLKEYLRTNKGVGRRELLLDISRGVQYIHTQDVVHGNLKITNALVDAYGRVRIGGFGAALLQSAMPGVDIDRFFHGAAPELVNHQRSGSISIDTTKHSDMYAFGVLAWEVFAGRAPFFDEGRIAGVYSMLNGRRPPRPEHPELSDSMWGMIEGCWKVNPTQRMTITEAVVILDV